MFSSFTFSKFFGCLRSGGNVIELIASSVKRVTHHNSPTNCDPAMDDDPELVEIRRRRLAQLQTQYQGKGNAPSQPSEQEAEAKRANEERRAMILRQLLTSEARERLNRIKLVKPEKAQGVEDMIIRAAQMGTLGGVVDEQRLIALLEQIQQQTETKSTVTVIRRKSLSDSEEESE